MQLLRFREPTLPFIIHLIRATCWPTSCRTISTHAFARLGARVYRSLAWHAYTALLFTWTDYKTIFFPVTAFACATAPVHSVLHLIRASIWVWLHLLLCNVSNQAAGMYEDALNRPWRPVPSGRITVHQATILRKTLVIFCLALSAFWGTGVLLSSAGLILTAIFYDELGFATNPIGKNFCNIWGYTMFQAGATTLIGYSQCLDYTSISAIALSGFTIFTTIQMQDFPDVVGDTAAGRITFPIYAPQFSRYCTLFALIAWSAFHSWWWAIGTVSTTGIMLLSILVGARCLWLRDQNADEYTYRIFNVWLILTFILPMNTRRLSMLAY